MSYSDSLCHSCTIYSKTTDQQLIYLSGTVLFQVGEIVTGSESGATGTVKNVTGSIGSGVLQLSNVSGTFTDGETLAGSEEGAAQASGTNSDYQDEFGQPSTSETSINSSCAFFKKDSNRSGIINSESGEHFRLMPRVSFPESFAGINKTDRITTTEIGWAGSYTVDDLHANRGPAGFHHFTADLEAVG